MENLEKITNQNYAIIEKSGEVLIAKGDIHYLNNLEDLEKLQNETKNKIIFITPFCLAGVEKGYETIGNEQIIALEVKQEILLKKEEILSLLPEENIDLGEINSSISDLEFADKVEQVKEEIQKGELNQLIISREFFSKINLSNTQILTIYKKLLQNTGQYMTFLLDTPNKTFIGASPERHLTIENQKIIMNPIAGTFPKNDLDTFYSRFVEFLKDEKEIGELAMVIDEELKMISKITNGGNIEVPILKEVGAVIHTEGNLIGDRKKDLGILNAFAETMYAPTLVGGPLESAFKQIKKYEPNSREYYGGAFGIYDKDFLDTAIVIRTAFIDKLNGVLSVRAGAGIVKDSNPEKESLETIFKSNGFFGNIEKGKTPNKSKYLESLNLFEKQEIQDLLEKRKSKLSKFYLENHLGEDLEVEQIKGKKFLLINNGDDFVNMSGYMIERMGGIVEIVKNKDFDMNMIDDFDFIMIGPGYGDINDKNDEKMLKLLDITEKLIASNKKILGICLGHQAICKVKGFEVKRQKNITQGEQLELDFNGKKEILGFYNSFSPVLNQAKKSEKIDIFGEDRILNFKDKNIFSTQSHLESIMSINGFEILKNMILELIKNNKVKID